MSNVNQAENILPLPQDLPHHGSAGHAHASIYTSARHLNSLQPVAALPWEVLEEIFVSACSYFPSYWRQGSSADGSRQTRQSIAATSHRWRNIALSTAGLWSTIYVRLEQLEDKYERSLGMVLRPSKALFELEIERSAYRRLRLIVHINGSPTTYESLWCPLLPLFRKAFPRSHTVQLKTTYPLAIQQLLTEINQSTVLPHLRIFAMICEPQEGHASLGGTNSDPPYLPIMLPSAPALSIISLRGPFLLSESTCFDVPQMIYSGHLPLRNIPFLQNCNNLRQLVLSTFSEDASILRSGQNRLLEFPYLQRLSYTHWGYGSIAYPVIHFIVAPQLEVLHLAVRAPYPHPNQFPSLRSLHLHIIADFGKELRTAALNLDRFPSIQELTLPIRFCDTRRSGKELIRVLKDRDEFGCFTILPLLRDVTGDFEYCAPKSIESLIKVRNSGASGALDQPFVVRLRMGDFTGNRTQARLNRQTWPIAPRPLPKPFKYNIRAIDTTGDH